MINGTPENFEKFPVPVTGTPIPRGWFGRLVAFMNSLVLRTDGRFFAVKHGPNGTTIAPTTALFEALAECAGTPPAAGGAVGFPDFYSNSKIVVDDSQSYDLTSNMWLIGRVSSLSSTSDASYYLNYTTTGSGSTPSQIRLFMAGDESPAIYHQAFVCLPIHSGLTISFSKDYIGIVGQFTLYPCIII